MSVYKSFLRRYTLILWVLVICGCRDSNSGRIERHQVVSRNNVVLTAIDTMGSLTVGNGEFAYTVDFTGLQTFPEHYENGIPLGTMSQWGWHSNPPAEGYTLSDVVESYTTCNDQSVVYPVQQKEGRGALATHWLRANPHRLHLGMVGFYFIDEQGNEQSLAACSPIRQELDLWTGKIESSFSIGEDTIRVIVYAHPDQDRISARVESTLIKKGQLKIRFRFPGGKECHTCPGYDWTSHKLHDSQPSFEDSLKLTWTRHLEGGFYYAAANWNHGDMSQTGPHDFVLSPASIGDPFEFSFEFADVKEKLGEGVFKETEDRSRESWEHYWRNGGIMDFSSCTDPRARELERRVVLSQYLTRVQCAGSLPPQETGLTMNSWYGKFHLEMHWWHGIHFVLWNRPDLMEKSMDWYARNMQKAHNTAVWQGYEGARWPKMTDPYGNESPSDIGAFIIWQQPHPIYFSELFYRNNPSEVTLNTYAPMVFETATFMADFIQYDSADGRFHLCQPIYAAQEIFPATQTNDPPFELVYWYWGLSTAQKWRERMGLPADSLWNEILTHIAPLPMANGYYLPVAGLNEAYEDQFRRDHPMVVGAFGLLPNVMNIDTAIMSRTYEEIMSKWGWETTWGWDYPMLAMAASRLGKPEMAIEALMLDVQKNTYLINGHNYQDNRLRLYLPGNGALLTAMAAMAAGWEGSKGKNPGFPKDGKWEVEWEGLTPVF